MKKILSTVVVLAAIATPALASAFWGGTVIGIAANDQLNVRAWPASYSSVIDSYENADNVSLTGNCKNTATNVTFSITGPQSAGWKHNKMKKPNVWCKVMTASAQLGWVRGKYVWPQ